MGKLCAKEQEKTILLESFLSDALNYRDLKKPKRKAEEKLP